MTLKFNVKKGVKLSLSAKFNCFGGASHFNCKSIANEPLVPLDLWDPLLAGISSSFSEAGETEGLYLKRRFCPLLPKNQVTHSYMA